MRYPLRYQARRQAWRYETNHVREILHKRLGQVRANIAELITLETHLQALLDNAERQPATTHDNSGVCWILEADV